MSKPDVVFLLLLAAALVACNAADGRLQAPASGTAAAAPRLEAPQDWAAYPVMAHRLRGKEAPIVRWVDTDGDGVSNYRLLCSFTEGRVRVHRIVPDESLRHRFRQARK